MKVQKTKYGVLVHFVFDDANDRIYFNGKYVSNAHIMFAPNEQVRVRFHDKQLKDAYNKRIPFSVDSYYKKFDRCRYDLTDMVETKVSDKSVISTEWYAEETNNRYRLFYCRSSNEMIYINPMYANIMLALGNKFNTVVDHHNMIQICNNDIAVGFVMMVKTPYGDRAKLSSLV